MLRTLEIRDMLIIDRLEIEFQSGLNVLTGETGAGKSILLDSLGFVLGWRGRADLVRQGADQGEVTAVFDLPMGHAARAILDDAGFEVEDELIFRRVNTSDGRKTAWINDRRASGEVLRAVSETLVELHGQHDDRGLLNPKEHRHLLDQFAGLEGDVAQIRAAYSAVSAAQRAVTSAESALAKAGAEEDFLRHAVAELEAMAPVAGEAEELDIRRRLMQGAEKIREDVARALQALGFDGAEGRMGDALRWLEGVADRAEGKLDEPINALGRAMIELGEASSGVERCLEALDFDPFVLEQTEERLFALRAMARKHQVDVDALADLAANLKARLGAIEQGDTNLAKLRADLVQAQKTYDQMAKDLSAKRRAAALQLDRAVMDELAPLKMDRAVFTTEITDESASAEGTDAVTFVVATNPGAPKGPLAKIASGGELSRFLLAIKVCLSAPEGGATMIFDEIDRGVGGSTADAVGRRLKSLADGGQILVVTHSPQVAALGAHHLRVEKRVVDDVTLSSVSALNADERVDEIARMISGDTITDEARAAAKALIG